MTRQEIINEINELMKPALELGFDWPSTELGFTDPNTASTEDLIDFLYEIELFVGNKEQEASE
jgi:hypothetical protein